MVASLREQYPELSKFDTTRDSSAEIWVMFRVLGSSAIFGAMLVLVILAWTMGLRISILVLIAIPFSMAVALVFLYFTGVPVSNMVVFSFILVLGMVVDGAIIVAENIHRHIERARTPSNTRRRSASTRWACRSSPPTSRPSPPSCRCCWCPASWATS